MNRGVASKSAPREAPSGPKSVEAPLIWAFDGPFVRCLHDLEDTLRRAIVQVGDVSRIAVLVELSLPRLRARIERGDAVQREWGGFLDRVTSRYGIPKAPRVRYVTSAGPLITLVIGYRS